MNTETKYDKPEMKTNPNPFSKINTFYLGGFKSFKDIQTIPIRPITLIFGQNSAGKSSLIKGMLYALDGEMTEQANFVKWNSENQEPDYMAWDRLLNNNSSKIEYAFSYNEKVNNKSDFEYMTDENIYQDSKSPENYQLFETYIYECNSDAYRMDDAFEYSNERDDDSRFVIKYNKNITSIESKLLDTLLNMVQECYESTGVKDSRKYIEYLLEEIYSVSIMFGRESNKIGRFIFHHFSKNTSFALSENSYDGSDPNAEIIKLMNKQIFSLLESLDNGDSGVLAIINGDYIDRPFSYFTSQACNDIKKYVVNGICNPLHVLKVTRQVALCILSDVLVSADLRPTTVGLAKMLYIDSSRSFMNEAIGPSEHNVRTWRNFLENPVTLESVNDWLKNKLQTNFQLRKTIKLKCKADLEKVISRQIQIEDVEFDGDEGIKIEDIRVKGRLLHVQDVGYGLQKLIPVLAAGSAVKYDKSNITQDIDIIAIEEPEMHLHPKLQSDLGDLFVDSVINNSEKTFMLETHSENLLQRILRRVREGKIAPDAISVLYVHPGVGEEGARIERLEIDDEGEFKKPWPSGFFDPREDDILA